MKVSVSLRLCVICGSAVALLYSILSWRLRLMEKWLLGLFSEGKGMWWVLCWLYAATQSDTSHSPHVTLAELSHMLLSDFLKVNQVKSSFSEKYHKEIIQINLLRNNKSTMHPHHKLELPVWNKGAVSMLMQNMLLTFCFTLEDSWLRGGSDGKEPACKAEDQGSTPESGRSPREGKATYPSILAWRIPWTEEPGGLQHTGPQRVRHNWATSSFL